MTSESFFEWLNRLLGGKLFTKLVYGYGKYLFLLFVCMLVYLANRYVGEKELIRIEKLKMEQKDLQFEVRALNSKLMKRSRQSHIYEQLKAMGSNLEPAQELPYELKR